jgi:hypothetical protein
MNQVVIAFFGALFGFALPFGANVWDKITRQRRYKAAIKKEIERAKQHTESKLNWLNRDVSSHVLKIDQDRVVETNNKKLYLGEKENFELNFRFWNEKYTDIILVLSVKEFSLFATIYQLFEDFTLKFKQMKQAFEDDTGDKKAMALICYQDLLLLFKEIERLVQFF